MCQVLAEQEHKLWAKLTGLLYYLLNYAYKYIYIYKLIDSFPLDNKEGKKANPDRSLNSYYLVKGNSLVVTTDSWY